MSFLGVGGERRGGGTLNVPLTQTLQGCIDVISCRVTFIYPLYSVRTPSSQPNESTRWLQSSHGYLSNTAPPLNRPRVIQRRRKKKKSREEGRRRKNCHSHEHQRTIKKLSTGPCWCNSVLRPISSLLICQLPRVNSFFFCYRVCLCLREKRKPM